MISLIFSLIKYHYSFNTFWLCALYIVMHTIFSFINFYTILMANSKHRCPPRTKNILCQTTNILHLSTLHSYQSQTPFTRHSFKTRYLLQLPQIASLIVNTCEYIPTIITGIGNCPIFMNQKYIKWIFCECPNTFSLSLYIYIYIYIYIYTCVYVCMWVCTCVCVCVCIYKHVYFVNIRFLLIYHSFRQASILYHIFQASKLFFYDTVFSYIYTNLCVCVFVDINIWKKCSQRMTLFIVKYSANIKHLFFFILNHQVRVNMWCYIFWIMFNISSS